MVVTEKDAASLYTLQRAGKIRIPAAPSGPPVILQILTRHTQAPDHHAQRGQDRLTAGDVMLYNDDVILGVLGF